MKHTKFFKVSMFTVLLAMLLCLMLVLTMVACNDVEDTDDEVPTCRRHVDRNNDGKCDKCGATVENNNDTDNDAKPDPDPTPDPDPKPDDGTDGGDTDGGDTTETYDLDFSSVVTDISSYTINIPSSTAYLGITTLQDARAASGGNPEVEQYLTAFDEYMKIIEGDGGTITFSQILYIRFQRKMVDIYQDVTEDRPLWEMEEDENGELVFKLDEDGEKIPVIDEETGEQAFETVVIGQEKIGEEPMKLFVAVDQEANTTYLHREIDDEGEYKYYLAEEDGDYLLDEDGNPIEFQLDETMSLTYAFVYEKDENGDYIKLTDENGNYVYADENTDPHEFTLEHIVEKEQVDFALDILKLRVVGDIAFACFALPMPDYCYGKGQWAVKLASGEVVKFTAKDLPKRYEDCTEKEKETYNVTNYITNNFVQSYAINLVNNKIYSLAGLDIAEIDPAGFFKLVGRPDDVWNIVVDNDSVLFQALNVTPLFDNEANNFVKKDNNGILYVENSKATTVQIVYQQYNGGFAYTVVYPAMPDRTLDPELVPHFIFDKKGNTYTFDDGKVKRIEGVRTNENDKLELVLSEKDYSDTSEKLELEFKGIIGYAIEFFLINRKLYTVVDGLLDSGIKFTDTIAMYIRDVEDVDIGEPLAKGVIHYISDEKGTNEGFSALGYTAGYDSIPYNDREAFCILYDDGILIIDKKADVPRVLLLKTEDFIKDEERELFKPVDSTITARTGNCIKGCYYREIDITYMGEKVESLMDVESVADIDLSALYLKINLGYVSGITETIVYASIDLLDTLHEIVCFDDEDDTTITRADDTSHLIAIEPIN